MKNLRAATISVAAAILTATANSQPPAETDPWFNEQRSGPSNASSSDNSEGSRIANRSPKAIQDSLLKSYQSTPESHLTRRLQLTEEAIAADPSKSEHLQEQLADLRRTRDGALAALATADRSGRDLDAAIQALAPYGRYYNGDPSLADALIRSDFAAAIEAHAQALSRSGEASALDAFAGALSKAGLARVLESRIQSARVQTQATQIGSVLNELQAIAPLEPGEAFLISSLFGSPEGKLQVGVAADRNADRNALEMLTRALDRRLGERFSFASATTNRADIILSVDLEPLDQQHRYDDQKAPSQIMGAVVEEPNPAFVDLVARYEKAFENYEQALVSYEMQYQIYLDSMGEDYEFNNARRDLEQANAKLQATPPPTGPGASPEWDAAVAEQQLAQSMAISITSRVMPEPIKPVPSHLAILEQLYLEPPTLVTSQESEDYEYTIRSHDYRFIRRAELDLRLPDSALGAQTAVELAHDHRWSESIGAHPRDPKAKASDHSPEEIESSQRLLELEFGAECARQFETLVAQIAKEASAGATASPLTLALKASLASPQSLALPPNERERLIQLAVEKGDLLAFRDTCLKVAAERLGSLQ